MKTKRRGNATQGKSASSQAVVFIREHCQLRAVLVRACVVTLACAALLLAFDSPQLLAKKKPPTSKTVTGQVFDASDNAIAGAAVEMKDLTTGKTSAIYVGPDGHFTFTDLKLTEDYQVQAHYKGQTSEVRKVSSWDTRTNLVINLHIPAPKD